MNAGWPQATKPYRANPPEGTAGLVLPIRENLKFFKLAFHSIMDFTDYRFMLTIVDNMCSYPVRQYLESIRRNHPINVVQYQQAHAAGAEWNLGLQFMFAFAHVQYGVVLTPDVVVEPNWLSRLVRTLDNKPDAILSPYSNASLERRTAQTEPIDRLEPFCAAFKRQAYERLSGFDGAFHESGHCMRDFGDRAKQAGFRLFSANEVYVHRFDRSGYRPELDVLNQDAAHLELKSRQVPA